MGLEQFLPYKCLKSSAHSEGNSFHFGGIKNSLTNSFLAQVLKAYPREWTRKIMWSLILCPAPLHGVLHPQMGLLPLRAENLENNDPLELIELLNHNPVSIHERISDTSTARNVPRTSSLGLSPLYQEKMVNILELRRLCKFEHFWRKNCWITS